MLKTTKVLMGILFSIVTVMSTSCNKTQTKSTLEESVSKVNDEDADIQKLLDINPDELSFDTTENKEVEFGVTPESPASDFDYELTKDGNGVLIKKYIGNARHVVIPEKIEGMLVTELGKEAFYQSVVEVFEIPNSITKMNEGIFSCCSKLKAVKLPNTIKEIPEDTFGGCFSLTNVTIPNSVTNIAPDAFKSCGLQSIEIPSSVTNIESDAFSGSNLESIIIPDSVITLRDHRDKGYDSISIFACCTKLKSIKISNSITKLPYGMFSKCESLREVILPTGLIEIGEGAFKDCISLENILLPETVTTIEKEAFENAGLKSLIIPDSVTNFNCSMEYCKNLESLRLPNTWTFIDDLIIGNDEQQRSNGFKYAGHASSTLFINLKSINIPSSIKKIGYESFSYLTNLQELIIPDSITSIEFDTSSGGSSKAFYGTSLPLATQKRLRDLGYTGEFKSKD